MKEALLEQIRKICLPLLTEQGVELVELLLVSERGRPCLKFLVDKPEGITLDECSQLNSRISQILERQNFIQESYILEVSSPGLDRPLVSRRDFQRCLGKLIRLILHKPLRRQNVWIGFVDGVDEEKVIIRTDKGESLHIARRNIAKAVQEVRP